MPSAYAEWPSYGSPKRATTPSRKANHAASSTEARAKTAAHASGELPHIEMRKKLVKQHDSASVGSAFTAERTSVLRSPAKMCSETAATQPRWKRSHAPWSSFARRCRERGDGPSAASEEGPGLSGEEKAVAVVRTSMLAGKVTRKAPRRQALRQLLQR